MTYSVHRALTTLFTPLLLALSACSGTPSLHPGATDFVTEEPAGHGGRGGGEFNGAPNAAGDSKTSTTPSNPGAPSGRTGTVEEADIYRVDQNRLFYFNTYRGFMIYDLADAKHPQRVSHLPVYGYPVEMYVDGNTVYALLRDSLYLTQDGTSQKFERHDTSQLVTIDVSDLAHPKVLKTIDIIGELREGVSRKIDDTIYVVSYIPQNYYGWWYSDWGWYGSIDTAKEQAWVYSFNVAQPTNPQLVDKLELFEGGSANGGGTDSSSSRYFNGLALSATANTLHVVENWQTSDWASGGQGNCGSYTSTQEAIVSVVDISDPSGHIRLHTKFSTQGHLGDQFKQTYVYDPATQKGHYFGIFERQEWSSSNCTGSQLVQNTLESWDITDGAAPKRVGSLAFGKPGETVGGSVFDPTRKVAYAITSRQVDPFYALSFADPTNLQVLSAVDGLAGDMSVFRFVGADNNYILGIGRDASDACNGFATGSTSWRTGVSVSIFDVKNTSAVRLVQRRCVDVKDAQWVSSDINWDLDQGHKMIGMQSDATANVITVPVSYYKRTDEQSWWWYRYSSAVGMMTWDLAAYDPTKTELQQNVLVNHGSVEHGHGGVRRSIVFTHGGADGNRRMLLNLSDTYLSLFDIQNLDAPVLQSEVELAPSIESLFSFGNYLVEHVRDEGYDYGYDTASTFRVKPVGGVIDDTAPAASFTIGQVQKVMKYKDSLIVFRRKIDPSQTNTQYGGYGYSDNEVSQAVVFDLADPTKPQLRSITDLPYSLYPTYRYWCGTSLGFWGGWWWGASTDFVSIDSGVAFQRTNYHYDNNGSATTDSHVVFLDLRDLGQPRVSDHQLAGNDHEIMALTSDSSDPAGFFLTYRRQVGSVSPWLSGQSLTQYKYYAQRWSLSGDDLSADAETNVPGQIVRTWRSGDRTLLLTQDNVYTWVADPNNFGNGSFDYDPRLHLLQRLDDSTASLLDSRSFEGRSLGSLVGDADRVYVTTDKAYRYSYATDVAAKSSGTTSTSSTADEATKLTVLDTTQLALSAPFENTLGLRNASAMGTSANRLYLNISGAGVLVLDVANPAMPVGRSFLRTLGWGSSLEISSDTLYVAAGNFGVFQRALADATLAH